MKAHIIPVVERIFDFFSKPMPIKRDDPQFRKISKNMKALVALNQVAKPSGPGSVSKKNILFLNDLFLMDFLQQLLYNLNVAEVEVAWKLPVVLIRNEP